MSGTPPNESAAGAGAPLVRCPWPTTDLDVEYHDREWGVPVHDDRLLFEMITLEGAQAGLSWSIVLRKREGYRAAFAGLDPERVAAFGDADLARLVMAGDVDCI